MRIRFSLILSLLVMALVVVPMASAQDSTPTRDQYAGELGASGVAPPGGVGGVSDESPNTPAPLSSQPAAATSPQPAQRVNSGSLPFTGLDAGMIVAFGAALLGVGVILRRFSGEPSA